MKPFTLHHGDCIEVMRTLADNSVDAIVCDPPYGLSTEPDMAEVLRHWLAGDDYQHKGSGFMGKTWDSFVPGPSVWREAMRVLKPGGHLLAFFGSRTYDIGTLAIRLAGFEVRDQAMWLYGSGFPKSLDVSKAIDKAAGAEREVVGKRTDGRYAYEFNGTANRPTGAAASTEDAERIGGFVSEKGIITAAATDAARQWSGWGTALKPAHEPICVARKPLIGTVAANVLAHGTGALNIDGCRVGTEGGTSRGENGSNAGKERNVLHGGNFGVEKLDAGRWPANLIHDGSDEVVALFPSTGVSSGGGKRNADKFGGGFVPSGDDTIGYGDTGSAARFFYCAKASKADRGAANHHPTVKPTDLMAYLCRLVTPPGGLVLDPFMGSGSTGKACMREGFRFTGIDMTAEYVDIARARIEHEHARVEAANAPPPPSPQLDLFGEGSAHVA